MAHRAAVPPPKGMLGRGRLTYWSHHHRAVPRHRGGALTMSNLHACSLNPHVQRRCAPGFTPEIATSLVESTGACETEMARYLENVTLRITGDVTTVIGLLFNQNRFLVFFKNGA